MNNKEFKSLLDGLKNKLSGLITTESSPEFIKQVQEINADVDKVEEHNNEAIEENTTLKNMVINSIKTAGNKTQPEDDKGGNSEKTFEEIEAEIIAKRQH